ncbi:hypothetical protein TgHK011_006883 [Trichoderma gracile]|nr:hypothetical protein TgHK011_006883 [Trichoderma gracile]
MAEAVGIALSVLPIVIWALEKYSEPLDAYSDYHRAIGTLQANLQIQRMHLEATLQGIGLRHPTPRELADCLRQRFPSNHREIAFIVRQMDEMMLGMMEGLQVDMSRKPLWTHASPERASCWNDDLRHLVQRSTSEETLLPHDDGGNFAVQRVRRLYNRGNCESVRRTLRSLHRALQAGLVGDGAEGHQLTGWRALLGSCSMLLAFNASLKTLFLFSEPPRQGMQHMEQIARLVQATPYPKSKRRRHFNHINPTSPPETTHPQPSPHHQPLQRTLLLPLPHRRTLRLPPGPNSIIIIIIPQEGLFSLSPLSRNHDTIIREISLEKIIATESQRVAPAIQPLSAKRRYGIAASLAWAVLYLADSPWLAHGLDRHKVKLFLQRKQASGFISLSEKAYLSSPLFAPRPLPSPASSSTSLHQTTPRRTPKSLIFDLGILLIELAVNQSFSTESLSAILQHDYRPLKTYLDRVELEAGIYYFNAAQRCVYGVFLADQGQMDFDLDRFQHEFYSTVVAPLQATYEGR